jgi:hypothetical protein
MTLYNSSQLSAGQGVQVMRVSGAMLTLEAAHQQVCNTLSPGRWPYRLPGLDLSRGVLRRGPLKIGHLIYLIYSIYLRFFTHRANSSKIHRTAAVMIALIVAGAFFVLDGNAQVITYQTVKCAELTGVIKNPGIGYQTFDQSAASNAQLPSSTSYVRLNWSQIEPVPGTYDFSLIDQALSQAQSAGQRLAFRIMGYEDGDLGPVGLKNAGYPGYTFTFDGYPNVWFPDMDQSIVQQDLARLIAALGKRYGNNPSIDSIDIGFVGDWGEFHFWNTTPQVPMPSTAALNTLSNDFLANVGVPLVIGGDLYDKNVNAFNYAIRNKIGWRADCWGDYNTSGWNHMQNLYPAIIANAPNAWKYAPVILEPCGTMSSWVSSNYPWHQALQWAIYNHASAFNDQSDTVPSVMYSAIQDMITKLGYRFVLTQAQLPTSVTTGASFNLTLNWTNKGNAPMYFDRRLLVKVGSQISDTGISMKGFLPGTRTDVATIGTQGLAAGTYSVRIGLAAPGSQTPDIRLAIQGTGLWYTLGNVIITARLRAAKGSRQATKAWPAVARGRILLSSSRRATKPCLVLRLCRGSHA